MEYAAGTVCALLAVWLTVALIIHPTVVVVEATRWVFGLVMLACLLAQLFMPDSGRPPYTLAFVIGTNLIVATDGDLFATVALYVFITFNLHYLGDNADFWLNELSAVIAGAYFLAFGTWTLVKRRQQIIDAKGDKVLMAYSVLTLLAVLVADIIGGRPDPLFLVASYTLGSTAMRRRGVLSLVSLGFLIASSVTLCDVSLAFLGPLIVLDVSTAAVFVYERDVTKMNRGEVLVAAIIALWVLTVTSAAYMITSTTGSTLVAAASIVALLVFILVASSIVLVSMEHERRRRVVAAKVEQSV